MSLFKHHLPPRLSLPILSGILIGTSYIPLPPWASLFLFVPLWRHWQMSKSLKDVFIAGWITQFILTFIGFHWVAHIIHEFGRLPMPIAYLGLLLFCGFANLYIPLAGIIWFKLRSYTGQGFHSLLMLPMIIWLAETFTPTIFKWSFGYLWLWTKLPAYHLAELIGTQGLSGTIIFANFICLMMWIHRHHKKKLAGLGLALFIFLIGINVIGWGLSKRLPSPDKKLHALVVQANIGNMEKVYAKKGWGFRREITHKYIALTRSAILEFQNKEIREKIDFVLWPETAFPNLLGKPYDNHQQAKSLFQMTRETQIPLITGAYSQTPESNQTTNSVFSSTRMLIMWTHLIIRPICWPLESTSPWLNIFPS